MSHILPVLSIEKNPYGKNSSVTAIICFTVQMDVTMVLTTLL